MSIVNVHSSVDPPTVRSFVRSIATADRRSSWGQWTAVSGVLSTTTITGINDSFVRPTNPSINLYRQQNTKVGPAASKTINNKKKRQRKNNNYWQTSFDWNAKWLFSLNLFLLAILQMESKSEYLYTQWKWSVKSAAAWSVTLMICVRYAFRISFFFREARYITGTGLSLEIIIITMNESWIFKKVFPWENSHHNLNVFLPWKKK